MIVTVIFPVTVDLKHYPDIKINKKKLSDDEYVEAIKDKIKDAASDILETSGIEPVIHSCEDCPELVD